MRYLIGVLICMVVWCGWLGVNYAGFTETNPFENSSANCVAWGDYNNDGLMDLAVGGFVKNALYENMGDGVFNKVIDFNVINNIIYAMTWADYDNDGDQDLGVGGQSQLYIFRNDGNGTFTRLSLPYESASFTTFSLAWGDCNNDGWLDLAVGNGGWHNSEQNYLYTNNHDGTFTCKPAFGEGRTISIAFGDYSNDGQLELAVGNREESYVYFTNNASVVDRIILGANEICSLAWGDYANDGDLDLICSIGNIQNYYLYINKGGNLFNEELPIVIKNSAMYSIAWGDYDNDGDQDFVSGNYGFDNRNYLYTNHGEGVFLPEEGVIIGTSGTNSLALADFDRDGDLDLATGNIYPYSNALYTNDLNTPGSANFVNVKLIGHITDPLMPNGSNRDGIGAKVFVYSGDNVGNKDYLLGFREIEANGGYCGQDSINAEFGIPTDCASVSVLVVWPGSGGSYRQEYWSDIAPGSFLKLNEGRGQVYIGPINE